MKVFKFGGASLKDASAIQTMSRILKLQNTTQQLLVVVSAMGKTTNALETLVNNYWENKNHIRNIENLREFFVQIAQNLFTNPQAEIFLTLEELFEKLKNQLQNPPNHQDDEAYDRTYDQIVSMGELISSKIIVAYLNDQGIPCEWLNASEVVQTNSLWREGQVNWEKTQANILEKVQPILEQKIVITQGFIGGNEKKEVTTLGREGSDFSGAIFAHCLSADSLTIWKDVLGVLNADPKKMPDAKLYTELSYEEAAEMTKYGASVIHPKTIAPLAQKNIPLQVKSFIYPQRRGTKISQKSSQQLLPTIIFKSKQVLIRFKAPQWGFLQHLELLEIIQEIAHCKLNVNLMHKTPSGLYLGVDDQAHRVEVFLERIPKHFEVSLQRPLQLIRIKNATEATIRRIIWGKGIVIEEKNTEWYQAIAYE